MMGQQETMTVAAEKAGGALRSIILALAIAALMVAMMVVMAAPAFAKNNFTYGHCVGGQGSEESRDNNPSHNNTTKIECSKPIK